MSIEIGDNTIAMWCIELGNAGNWLAHLARGGPNGKYLLDYRFRYYVDDLVQNSRDRRNWYRGELSGRSDDEMLRKLRRVFDEMRGAMGGRGWELVRGARSVEEFTRALGKMPGIHVGEPMTEGELTEAMRKGLHGAARMSEDGGEDIPL